jgi:hypothetical protein
MHLFLLRGKLNQSSMCLNLNSGLLYVGCSCASSKYYQFSIRINVDSLLAVCSSFLLHTIAIRMIFLLITNRLHTLNISYGGNLFKFATQLFLSEFKRKCDVDCYNCLVHLC